MGKKQTKEQISYNMSQIKSSGTKLERRMENILNDVNFLFEANPSDIFGKPDFINRDNKIAIFADSDFWHGYDWESSKNDFKTNKEFWVKKIERNIQRDNKVTKTLQLDGWRVLRFWGHEIRRQPKICKKRLLETIMEM